MTDEDLIDDLRRLAVTYSRNSLAFYTIQRTITRIGDATKHPANSIPVRIAVASGKRGSFCAMIDQDARDEDQIDLVRRMVEDYSPLVLAEAIVTAHIPLRVVLEVAGRLEAFNLEATK